MSISQERISVLPLLSFLFKERLYFCLLVVLKFVKMLLQCLEYFTIFFPSCRLESQMTADIQTILQLLQKQTTVVPPAYSMVTAGAEYQRPILRLMRTSHPTASIKTDRSFSPSSQVSVDISQPRVYLTVCVQMPQKNLLECCAKYKFPSPLLFLLRISDNKPLTLCYPPLKFENNRPRRIILFLY